MEPERLERRKKVRVRLRPNLTLVEQRSGGAVCYVLQDPVSLRYFQVTPRQRYVSELMDGTRTLDEIRVAYEARFRPDRVSLDELEAFASQLLHGGLAQNESPRAGELLFARAEKQRRQQWLARLFNFLYLKVPLGSPDRLLGRLLPWLGWLFNIPGALAVLALGLAALALVATHWSEFVARLPHMRELMSVQTLLHAWLALGLVKIWHELGHGLACKKFGGDVPEMGLLFLFFFPCLYCDVSDSWRIASRWRRIVVSAAGMYVELPVAALATLGWWLTDPSTMLHHLLLSLMVVCSVNTLLFNANPLVRFDGYYILADWLEVPNLAEESQRIVRGACLRWLGIKQPVEPGFTSEKRWLLGSYAIASYVYRCTATVVGLYLIYAFLEPHKLGPLGYLIAAASVGVMLGLPLYRLGAAILRQGRLPDMKPARVLLALGAVILAALFAWGVPLPQNVRGTAILQIDPDEVQRVVVPQAGGFLKEVVVRDGARVRAGEVIAVLDNPALEIKLRVNEADRALRLQQKTAYLTELADAAGAEGTAATGLQQTDAELLVLAREQALLREQRSRLTLRAPADGIVAGLPPLEARGKWQEPGTELCHVGNDASLRAALLVAAADHELVAPNSKAWVHVHGSGLRRVPGAVKDIAQVDAKSIPPALARRLGGDVATQHDAASGRETPYQPHYLVAVRLPRRDPSMHPGALAHVRIEAAPQTLWRQFRRVLGTTFSWGL